MDNGRDCCCIFGFARGTVIVDWNGKIIYEVYYGISGRIILLFTRFNVILKIGGNEVHFAKKKL